MTHDASDISRAADVLRRGGLVAFPTETVYGLGADANSVAAVKQLYRVKGRPPDHPVIVHIAAGVNLADYAHEVPDLAVALARAFWPGPLTMVLPKRPECIVDEATGGRPTVGLRVPNHPIALALLECFGRGVAAPSANHFGRVSPTTAAHVRADLGRDVDVVLDGGPSRVGVESTIVDLSGTAPAILRIGGVPAEDIARVAGSDTIELRDQGDVAAPGTLPSHYAPDARVELVEAAGLGARAVAFRDAGARVGVLAPAGALRGELPGAVVLLDCPADVETYARVLYARLREADAAGLDVVLAVPPAPTGVGAAICDRLHRASADTSRPQR